MFARFRPAVRPLARQSWRQMRAQRVFQPAFIQAPVFARSFADEAAAEAAYVAKMKQFADSGSVHAEISEKEKQMIRAGVAQNDQETRYSAKTEFLIQTPSGDLAHSLLNYVHANKSAKAAVVKSMNEFAGVLKANPEIALNIFDLVDVPAVRKPAESESKSETEAEEPESPEAKAYREKVTSEAVGQTQKLTPYTHMQEQNQAARQKIIDRLVNDLEPGVAKMLLGMIEIKKVSLFPEVHNDFTRLLINYNGEREVVVYSAVDLTKAQLKKVQSKCKAFTGDQKRKLVFKNEVNPKILGGLAIAVDGKILDLTVGKQIHELTKTIQDAVPSDGAEAEASA